MTAPRGLRTAQSACAGIVRPRLLKARGNHQAPQSGERASPALGGFMREVRGGGFEFLAVDDAHDAGVALGDDALEDAQLAARLGADGDMAVTAHRPA
jgi:hypothetical protein